MKRAKPKPAPLRLKEADPEGLYLWSGFEQSDGYGYVSASLVRALAPLVPLNIQTPEFYHRRLQSHSPDIFDRLVGGEFRTNGRQLSIQSINSIRPIMGKMTAVLTMHESSKLAPTWVQAINRYDLVIVPGRENADHFRAQIKPRVEVVNLGLDLETYAYQPKTPGNVFVFGTAGNIRHVRERKGMDRVLEWFLAAFPGRDDVRLTVKLNAPKESFARNHDHPLGPEDYFDDSDPRVTVIRENMPTEKTVAWLRSIDVYVDASTYEGWGYWPFQAMAIGRPVIGTMYGAHREYFKPGNHIPIGYRIERAQSHYRNLGEWAMPDASDGIEAMRYCSRTPRLMAKMGKLASDSIQGFTWDASARRVLDVMRKHGIYG